MAKQRSSFSEDNTSIRHVLADFILNVQVPDDLYSILISLVTIYIVWKLLRFSISIVVAVVRPIVVILMLIALLTVALHFSHSGATNGVKGILSNVGSTLAFGYDRLELILSNIIRPKH